MKNFSKLITFLFIGIFIIKPLNASLNNEPLTVPLTNEPQTKINVEMKKDSERAINYYEYASLKTALHENGQILLEEYSRKAVSALGEKEKRKILVRIIMKGRNISAPALFFWSKVHIITNLLSKLCMLTSPVLPSLTKMKHDQSFQEDLLTASIIVGILTMVFEGITTYSNKEIENIENQILLYDLAIKKDENKEEKEIEEGKQDV